MLIWLALGQVTSCLVKEGTDCENLVEQMLSAVFSRYLDANEVASVSDGNEVSHCINCASFLIFSFSCSSFRRVSLRHSQSCMTELCW